MEDIRLTFQTKEILAPTPAVLSHNALLAPSNLDGLQTLASETNKT